MNGIPDNPPAWLLTTARRRAIDAIRRERTRRTFAADRAKFLDSEWTLAATVDEAFDEHGIKDDQLRMIFMCCHPMLSPENRITLILKTLCGLSVPAIARALLTTEATINKRLYRTRAALRGVQFEIPGADDLPAARDTVHTALYLLFNEGHLSTADKPILRELCRDAMLLTRLLADHPAIATSDTAALLALMCFNAARLESRLDDERTTGPARSTGSIALGSGADQTRVPISGALVGDGCGRRDALSPRGRDRRAALLRGVVRRHRLGVDLSSLRSAARSRAVADGRAQPGRRGVVSRRPGSGDSARRSPRAGRGAAAQRTSSPPCSRICIRAPDRAIARGRFWKRRSGERGLRTNAS